MEDEQLVEELPVHLGVVELVSELQDLAAVLVLQQGLAEALVLVLALVGVLPRSFSLVVRVAVD